MIHAIIFDFDGTIINTNALIEKGLNYFSMLYRNCYFTAEEINQITGKTLEDQMAFISPDNAQDLVKEFRDWYKQHHNNEVSAFPGMIQLLQFLKKLEIKLAIVTNNSRESLDMGLKHLEIETIFDFTITRDDVSETKPNPEGLLKALNTLDVAPREALYVGDTGNDIKAAKSAGVPSVMVGWTILDDLTVQELDPDIILKSPSSLLEVLINSALAA